MSFIIYFPVWIDQCAPPASQTMWISVYFLTVPLGILFGYGSAILLSNLFPEDLLAWKWSFLIQTFLMLVPIALCFGLFPQRYFLKSETEGNLHEMSVNDLSQVDLLYKSYKMRTSAVD